MNELQKQSKIPIKNNHEQIYISQMIGKKIKIKINLYKNDRTNNKRVKDVIFESF